MKIAGDTARVSPVFYLHSALGGTGPQLFFALSATYAAMVLILWVVIYRLQPVAALPPVLWHAHEMLFGVAAAGLAGLAYGLAPPRLHAPPASGVRVAVPALIWLLGRVAMAATGVVPSWLAALTDLAFIPVFAALVIMPGFATRPRRNLALLALFGGLWLGDLAMHAAALGTGLGLADWGARLAVHLYMLAIAVIGGAAIPVLTNRALRGSGVAITVPAMSWRSARWASMSPATRSSGRVWWPASRRWPPPGVGRCGWCYGVATAYRAHRACGFCIWRICGWCWACFWRRPCRWQAPSPTWRRSM